MTRPPPGTLRGLGEERLEKSRMPASARRSVFRGTKYTSATTARNEACDASGVRTRSSCRISPAPEVREFHQGTHPPAHPQPPIVDGSIHCWSSLPLQALAAGNQPVRPAGIVSLKFQSRRLHSLALPLFFSSRSIL